MSEPSGRHALLTVKEYADLMRVHPETVKRWIRDGHIKAERTCRRGHWRINHQQQSSDMLRRAV
jgi:excisionase family DNA binding protein